MGMAWNDLTWFGGAFIAPPPPLPLPVSRISAPVSRFCTLFYWKDAGLREESSLWNSKKQIVRSCCS